MSGYEQCVTVTISDCQPQEGGDTWLVLTDYLDCQSLARHRFQSEPGIKDFIHDFIRSVQMKTVYLKSDQYASTVYSYRLVFLLQTMLQQSKDLQRWLQCHQFLLLQ